MGYYIFQMSDKLTRKQLNIIIKNLQLYCDEIKCENFDIYLYEDKREKLYEINILLYDLDNLIYDNVVDENNNVIKLVKFYLNAFESGNDDKVF